MGMKVESKAEALLLFGSYKEYFRDLLADSKYDYSFFRSNVEAYAQMSLKGIFNYNVESEWNSTTAASFDMSGISRDEILYNTWSDAMKDIYNTGATSVAMEVLNELELPSAELLGPFSNYIMDLEGEEFDDSRA